MKKLTPKQEKFANLYIELGNASEAYRKAYNVSNPDADWIASKASHILSEDNIRTRVEELQEATAEEYKIDRSFIVKGLLEIISDADYTFKLGKDNTLGKEDSKAFFRLMNQTKNTDKLRALEQLAKMLGLNEPEKIELKDTSHKTKWG
jgi:phage terminase small subunit